MNQTKPAWTPGLWLIHERTTAPIDIIATNDGTLVASVWTQFPNLNRNNARLIAAAPQMYEALRDAVDVMVHVDPNIGDNWRQYAAAIDTARAAIAAATGEPK